MSLILSDMGVQKYDDGVVGQLVELLHRHVSDIAEESDIIAQHSGHESVDADDVKVAIRQHRQFAFTQVPTLNTVTRIAAEVNFKPLSAIPTKAGLALPDPSVSLGASNYHVVIDPNRPPRPDPPSPPPLPRRRPRVPITRPPTIKESITPNRQLYKARQPYRAVREGQQATQPVSIRVLPPKKQQPHSPQRPFRRVDDRRVISKDPHHNKSSPRTPVNIRNFRDAEPTSLHSPQGLSVRMLPPRRPHFHSPDRTARRPNTLLNTTSLPPRSPNLVSSESPGRGSAKRREAQMSKPQSGPNRNKLRDVATNLHRPQQHIARTNMPLNTRSPQQPASDSLQIDQRYSGRAIGSYAPKIISTSSRQAAVPSRNASPLHQSSSPSPYPTGSLAPRPVQRDASPSYVRPGFEKNPSVHSRVPVIHTIGGAVSGAPRAHTQGPDVRRKDQRRSTVFNRTMSSAQPNALFTGSPGTQIGAPDRDTVPARQRNQSHRENEFKARQTPSRSTVGAPINRKDQRGLTLGQGYTNEGVGNYPPASNGGATLSYKPPKSPKKKSQKRTRASLSSATAKRQRLDSSSAMPPPPEIVDLDGPGTAVQPPPPLPRPIRRKSKNRNGSTRGRGRPPNSGKSRIQGDVITIDE